MYVMPYGNADAEIIFVGSFPTRQEIINSKPFTDIGGRLLHQLIDNTGLNKFKHYYTTIFKNCNPKDEINLYWDFKKGLTYAGSLEVNNLYQELANFNGDKKIIIAIDEVALSVLTDKNDITKWRGSIIETAEKTNLKIPVLPILNPNTINYPTFQEENKYLISWDLAKVYRFLTGQIIKKEREYIIKPSFETCINFLNNLKEKTLIACDIESTVTGPDSHMICISFAIKGKAICIPFIHNAVGLCSYFSIEQELQIMFLIKEILENKSITKIGQNFFFDAFFLRYRYDIITVNIADTMLAQQMFCPDIKKGLDMITSIWVDDIPYYKADGKHFLKGQTKWEREWIYNCTDSFVCFEAYPKLLEYLEKNNNLGIFKQQCLAIEAFLDMAYRGIKVNLIDMKKVSKEMSDEIQTYHEELKKIVEHKNPSFIYTEKFPNSSKQLKEYFDSIGVYPYVNKAGKRAFDMETLKKMMRPVQGRPALKEANLIHRIRSNVKLVSTYTNPAKIDPDGRIRCSYNIAGTRFSRASSSESIFGGGMNMQNWPHSMLKYLIADDGFLYCGLDYSQAENRIVAYLANDEKMKEPFKTGRDTHCITAGLFCDLSYEEIKRQDAEGIMSPLGHGKLTWRGWGKKGNHSLNYDFSYRSASLLWEVSEEVAKYVINKFHSGYPGVRNVFHSYIRKEIRKHKKLVNLLGRTIIFIGKPEDRTFKQAYSCIPQSTVGDMINGWGLNYIKKNFPLEVQLLNQVHDSIGFQIPLNLGWKRIAEILINIKINMEQPLTSPWGKVFTIPIDLHIGTTLSKSKGQGTEIKGKAFSINPEELSKTLEEKWGSL